MDVWDKTADCRLQTARLAAGPVQPESRFSAKEAGTDWSEGLRSVRANRGGAAVRHAAWREREREREREDDRGRVLGRGRRLRVTYRGWDGSWSVEWDGTPAEVLVPRYRVLVGRMASVLDCGRLRGGDLRRGRERAECEGFVGSEVTRAGGERGLGGAKGGMWTVQPQSRGREKKNKPRAKNNLKETKDRNGKTTTTTTTTGPQEIRVDAEQPHHAGIAGLSGNRISRIPPLLLVNRASQVRVRVPTSRAKVLGTWLDGCSIKYTHPGQSQRHQDGRERRRFGSCSAFIAHRIVSHRIASHRLHAAGAWKAEMRQLCREDCSPDLASSAALVFARSRSGWLASLAMASSIRRCPTLELEHGLQEKPHRSASTEHTQDTCFFRSSECRHQGESSSQLLPQHWTPSTHLADACASTPPLASAASLLEWMAKRMAKWMVKWMGIRDTANTATRSHPLTRVSGCQMRRLSAVDSPVPSRCAGIMVIRGGTPPPVPPMRSTDWESRKTLIKCSVFSISRRGLGGILIRGSSVLFITWRAPIAVWPWLHPAAKWRLACSDPTAAAAPLRLGVFGDGILETGLERWA
ncbi:hypothetical protein JHW43_005262 [Diplocarpon mali]|nr:hypothetical protein JHW43_005262 [Diplocarpon mali]